uniref:Cytochrome P450 n=1 Tax=Nothapodytes nimmoniana TaxID=159386 RepID=A0A7L7RBB2_NOTNI|nr:cytochrome P450 [Nothapodytes nimmoniana]
MSFLILVVITCLTVFLLFELLKGRVYGTKNLPKGSMGFPVIGETLSFLQAQNKEQGQEWINERVVKYGPVFKTFILGSPTVVILGQAGNKFLFCSAEDVLVAQQPKTISALAGKYNIIELTGLRYKLIKRAMMSFLKLENLQNYIKHMDDLVKEMLFDEIQEKETVIQAVSCMKKITFNLACKILFAVHDEQTRDALFDDFSIAFKAFWSLPLNFPGTVYWRGLQARSRLVKRLRQIIEKRQEELLAGASSPKSDIISSLLALKAGNEEIVSDEVIVDNFISLIIASHDTSSILTCLMLWKMCRDSKIYEKVLEEQMEIAKNKKEKLTWSDLQKMKYTWRVAQELMRLIPPVFGSFRKAIKETSFAGYVIPKGWQVFWTACGTHMDNNIFENPMEFNPSRFEDTSKSIPPYTYIPFGGGIHMCIGNEFARVETLTIIHRLVTMYEWSQLHPEETITRQPMPYPSMGLPINIKPKKLS